MSFKQTLLGAFGSLGRFLAILFKDALQKELEVVLPIAIGAVTSVASDPTLIQSGEKRDAAVALIIAQLVKAQVTVGLSVIHLGVELAVQNVKANSTLVPVNKPGA